MLSSISIELEIAAKIAWLLCLISPLLLVKKSKSSSIASFSGGFLCIVLFFCSFFSDSFVYRDNFIYTGATFNMFVLANLIVYPMYKALPKIEAKTFLFTILAINIGFGFSLTASTLTTKAHTLEDISDIYRSQIVGYINNDEDIFDATCYLEGVPKEPTCSSVQLDDKSYQKEKQTVITDDSKTISIKHSLNYSERGNTHIRFKVEDLNSNKSTVFIYRDIPSAIESNNLGITSLIILVIAILWGSMSWNVYFIHKRASKRKRT